MNPRRARRTLLLAVVALAALTASACTVVHNNGNNGSTTTIGSAPYTEGSGKVTTQTRTLTSFHAVSVENGVTVFVKRGSADSADVTADDNLTTLIATDVQDGTLRIRVTGSLTTHNQLKVDVTATMLIDAITQTGGSTVDVEDLASDSLTASVDGGSTLRAGGRTANLRLTANGGSTADLQNVEARTAQVQVDGGSTAFVNARDAISGTCHGGSTLKVSGTADFDSVQKDAGSTVVRG